MLSSEMPFKLLFEGFVELDGELELPELLELLELLSFFFPTKNSTGITIANATTTSAITIAIQMS